MHQIGEASLLALVAVSESQDGTVPLFEVGTYRGVHRHRHGPAAGVEQRRPRIKVGCPLCEGQPEPRYQCQNFGVVGIDELGATFARLSIAELVAEHPPADSVTGFENDNVEASLDQNIGAPQPGEAAADDRYVEHVSDSSQNSVGCSAMMRRGTPGHGT
jgi:hypothetical protein